MRHIVLLGDSVLDNAGYTAGEPAVIDHLCLFLPETWKATRLARDGSLTTDVIGQLEKLPVDATHLVVSAGGNNALQQIALLGEPAQSVAEALQRMNLVGEQFERDYQQMLQAILAHQLPTILCTIYNTNLDEPFLQPIVRAGLMTFNDTILRAAFQAGLAVIDLRLICITPEDYTNSIEPSAKGGQKIANAIAQALQVHDFKYGRTVVYV